MPIKVGFSTSVCPDWDIHQIATNANEMGFYGVELGVVRDEIHLPAAEDLQTDKEIDAVRSLFEENNVELVSLASLYSFEARERNVVKRSFDRTVENIVLAGKLGCPFVRVPLGRRVGREAAEATLARQVPPLTDLARVAARNDVTLLVCNTPGLPSSRDVWFVVDGVSHPNLAAAWNPVLGVVVQEDSTLAIPRLGARIRAVQAANATVGPHGVFEGYSEFIAGAIDYALTIDLLKGVLFDGYLMLDWPKSTVEELPDPADALPAALSHLLDRIKHTEPELTAYKKDKYAANWKSAGAAFVERKIAAAETAAEAESGGEAAAAEADTGKPRVPKGGDPRIAALVAEAVKKVRAARAAKEGK